MLVNNKYGTLLRVFIYSVTMYNSPALYCLIYLLIYLFIYLFIYVFVYLKTTLEFKIIQPQ
jgi:hypothetical protein